MAGRLTTSSIRPDPVLSNVSVITAKTGQFVLDRLMPVVPVGIDAFKYAQYDTSDLTEDVAVERAIGAPANEVKFNMSWIDGRTGRRSLKSKLPRELLAQAVNEQAVRNRRIATVTTRIKIGMERSLRNKLIAVTSAGTPTVKWDAGANVTIKKNIDAFKLIFKGQAGILPNTILLGWQVAQVVSNDSDILARQKQLTNDLVTNGDVPPVLFNMDTVVGGASSKSDAASTLADIWNTDDVWLAYVEPNINEESMTFGAQFRAPAAGGVPIASAEWPDPDLSANSDWYYSEFNQTEVVTCPSCILRISDVLSAI